MITEDDVTFNIDIVDCDIYENPYLEIDVYFEEMMYTESVKGVGLDSKHLSDILDCAISKFNFRLEEEEFNDDF